MGDLEVLLAVLEGHRATLTSPQQGWPLEAFNKAFPGLPLFHRLGSPLREPETSLASSSITLEVARSTAGRTRIGTDECVFVSFGVACYWDPPVVIAFGPAEACRSGRTSVPWDSRGAGTVLKLSERSHAALIQEYSLESPHDEAYLASHLATCFQEWDLFLSGCRPKATDPRGVLKMAMEAAPGEDQSWLTTPEARFGETIELGEQLLAVFVDADFPTKGDREWRKTFTVIQRVVERRGGKFVSLRRSAGAVDYMSSTSEFVRGWMRERGYLT